MTDFKPIISKNDGKIVIITQTYTDHIVPLFCHVCKFPMRTAEDSIAYRLHGVCNGCDGRWTNHRDVDWKAGKMPNSESKDWIDYLEERAILSRPIIRFK